MPTTRLPFFFVLCTFFLSFIGGISVVYAQQTPAGSVPLGDACTSSNDCVQQPSSSLCLAGICQIPPGSNASFLDEPCDPNSPTSCGSISQCINVSGVYGCGINVQATPLPVSISKGINTAFLKSYADSFIGIINNLLVPLLLALAFITFLFGVYNYFIAGATSEEKRKKGKQFVLYSIIGFVIIFSLWGIINVATSTLSLPSNVAPSYPTL